jgi:hypothetical protein
MTNAVTNLSDHLIEAASNIHGHEDPMCTDADMDEVYDLYGPYDNADLDDVLSTLDQIDTIAERETLGNGAKEFPNAVNQMDEIPGVAATHLNRPSLDPVAQTYQPWELSTAEPHAIVSNCTQIDRNPGADAIPSNPHPKLNLQWAPVSRSLQSAEHATVDLHAAVNNTHHTDKNRDVDVMSSNAHQSYPSLQLGFIAEALIINASSMFE